MMREPRVAVKGEIAGLDTFHIDFIACYILRCGDSRDIDSGVSVGGLCKSRTIISWISGSAQTSRPADLFRGEGDGAAACGLVASCSAVVISLR